MEAIGYVSQQLFVTIQWQKHCQFPESYVVSAKKKIEKVQYKFLSKSILMFSGTHLSKQRVTKFHVSHPYSWGKALGTGRCQLRITSCCCINVCDISGSFQFLMLSCVIRITAVYLHLKQPVHDSQVNSHGNQSSGSRGTNWSAAAPGRNQFFVDQRNEHTLPDDHFESCLPFSLLSFDLHFSSATLFHNPLRFHA